jgi:hypothetical protein
MIQDGLFLNIDGTLLCTKSGTTITIKTDDIFDFHKARCEEWGKMRERL